MGKAYSCDLRERVLKHIKAGHMRRDAAARFGVSPSFAIKLDRRIRETDSSEPSPQGRPSDSGPLSVFRDHLIRLVEARPDITLRELAETRREAACYRAVWPKNIYAHRSRISEKKIREIIRCFVADVTALQTAELTSVNRNRINRIYSVCASASSLLVKNYDPCSMSSKSMEACLVHVVSTSSISG